MYNAVVGVMVIYFSPHLAESWRAGRELADLQVVIIICVFLLLRVHMMIPI